MQSLADIVRRQRRRSRQGGLGLRRSDDHLRQLDAAVEPGRPGACGPRASAPQDRVAFLDKNGIEYFELLFGGGKLQRRLRRRQLAPGRRPRSPTSSTTPRPRCSSSAPEFVPVLDAIADQLTTVTKIVVIGGHDGHESLRDVARRRTPAADPGVAVAAATTSALQLYSSGTTGLPKGVMLTNDNFFALLPTAGDDVGLRRPTSVNLVAMPLFHIGGGGWAIVGHVRRAPRASSCATSTRPRSCTIDRRARHHPRLPRARRAAVHADGARASTTPTSRRCETIVYGASPITRRGAGATRSSTFGCEFCRPTGSPRPPAPSSTCRPRTTTPTGPTRHRLRACGQARPGRRAAHRRRRHRRRRRRRARSARSGCAAPQNMKGYWNMPEETAETIAADGWFRTGDAGYLDADGYLYIHDRVKDMIVSGRLLGLVPVARHVLPAPDQDLADLADAALLRSVRRRPCAPRRRAGLARGAEPVPVGPGRVVVLGRQDARSHRSSRSCRRPARTCIRTCSMASRQHFFGYRRGAVHDAPRDVEKSARRASGSISMNWITAGTSERVRDPVSRIMSMTPAGSTSRISTLGHPL